MSDDAAVPPSPPEIREARARLRPWIRQTPIWQWRGPLVTKAVGPQTETFLKLELFQFAGSFKPRGALSVMLALPPAAVRRAVTPVSAGNHAIARGSAAAGLGTRA